MLWQQIVQHRLRPGDKLLEQQVSAELGVSRTPVREALQRLVQDGIVRAETRRGFYVASFSSKDVREIYDVRAALEVLAVRLAGPLLHDEQLAAAQRDLDVVEQQLAAGDDRARETFLQADREFHQMLARVAQNERLAMMLASLQAQIGVFQVYGIQLHKIVRQSLAHHQAILAALRQRDSAQAQQAMAQHIAEIKAWVLDEFMSLEADGSLQ